MLNMISLKNTTKGDDIFLAIKDSLISRDQKNDGYIGKFVYVLTGFQKILFNY